MPRPRSAPKLRHTPSVCLALAEFLPHRLLIKLLDAENRGGANMKPSVCLERPFVGMTLMLFVSTAHAQVASIYGGSDGLCGHRTANGERLNCAAMTAAHRRLPFGTLVRVCHSGCATVRINDRGPFVRGRDIDLSPAAARAIGLSSAGHVTISRL
jgi:rare lipoprotein A